MLNNILKMEGLSNNTRYQVKRLNILLCLLGCLAIAHSTLATSQEPQSSIKNCKILELEKNSKFCRICEKGFYLSGDRKSCEACSKGCVQCEGPESSDCVFADFGYFMDEQNYLKPCPMPGCASCSSVDSLLREEKKSLMICHGCLMGHFEENQDLEDDVHNVACHKCLIEHCSMCEDAHSCLFCEGGYSLFEGGCKKDDEKGCQSFNIEGDCVDCPQGMIFFENDKKCKPCQFPCLGCSAENVCSTCVPGYTLNKASLKCEPCKVPDCISCFDGAELCDQCIPGKYYDPLANACLPCDESCFSCLGPKKTDCESCKPGSLLHITRLQADKKTGDELHNKIIHKLRKKYANYGKLEHYLEKNSNPYSERTCEKTCPDSKTFRYPVKAVGGVIDLNQCDTFDVPFSEEIFKAQFKDVEDDGVPFEEDVEIEGLPTLVDL